MVITRESLLGSGQGLISLKVIKGVSGNLGSVQPVNANVRRAIDRKEATLMYITVSSR
jgi:hypothetical protein